ncbi:MAG: DUF2231 domain-containing protein [Candidatus Latescibacterota bacterium]
MLPEWAPNWHPLIVHFPVVLPVAAVLVDALALAARRFGWLPAAVTAAYLLAALAAWAAYLSGRQAADGVLVPAAANPLLTEHEDWAERTVWFFAVLALVRIGVHWKRPAAPVALRLALLLAGVAGTLLLYQTGERGAQLVFRHGVGVAAAAPAQAEAETHDHAHHEGAGPVPATGVRGASRDTAAGPRHLPWYGTGWQGASPAMVHDAAAGDVLAIRPEAGGALFAGGDAIGDVQADVRVDLDELQGEVRIVHHLQDPANYHFLSLGQGAVRLGLVRQGEVTLQDSGAHAQSGWLTARVVSDGTHFRGYVDDRLVVHGHGQEPSPGRVGLRVEGQGEVRVASMSVTALKERP